MDLTITKGKPIVDQNQKLSSSSSLNLPSSSTDPKPTDPSASTDPSPQSEEKDNEKNYRFQLTHNGHKFGHLPIKFLQYFQEGRFFDLSIACEEGKIIKCHKAVFASYSPVFDSLLNASVPPSTKTGPTVTKPVGQFKSYSDDKNLNLRPRSNSAPQWSDNPLVKDFYIIPSTNDKPTIFVTDFKEEDVMLILNFIYFGKLKLNKQEFYDFCMIAHTLGFTGLPLDGILKSKLYTAEEKQSALSAPFSKIRIDKASLDILKQDGAVVTRQQVNQDELTYIHPNRKKSKLDQVVDVKDKMNQSSDISQVSPGPSQSQESSTSRETPSSTGSKVGTSPESQVGVEVKQEPDDVEEVEEAVQAAPAQAQGQKRSRVSFMKRALVRRDLERGYSVKEISQRHKISDAVVKRWRWEQRRLALLKSSIKKSKSNLSCKNRKRNNLSPVDESSDEELVSPTNAELRAAGMWFVVN